MPYKTLTFKRWEIVAAFLILGGMMTVGLVLATRASDRSTAASRTANATAVRADRLARQLKAERDARTRLREAQIRALHENDVRGCGRVHRLDRAAVSSIERSLALTRRLHVPGVDTAELVAESERTLRDLRAADCRGVPPLPPSLPDAPGVRRWPPRG